MHSLHHLGCIIDTCSAAGSTSTSSSAGSGGFSAGPAGNGGVAQEVLLYGSMGCVGLWHRAVRTRPMSSGSSGSSGRRSGGAGSVTRSQQQRELALQRKREAAKTRPGGGRGAFGGGADADDDDVDPTPRFWSPSASSPESAPLTQVEGGPPVFVHTPLDARKGCTSVVSAQHNAAWR